MAVLIRGAPGTQYAGQIILSSFAGHRKNNRRTDTCADFKRRWGAVDTYQLHKLSGQVAANSYQLQFLSGQVQCADSSHAASSSNRNRHNGFVRFEFSRNRCWICDLE